MALSIIIGLVIWLAVPLLFQGKYKKKHYNFMKIVCKIVGITIIFISVVNYFRSVC